MIRRVLIGRNLVNIYFFPSLVISQFNVLKIFLLMLHFFEHSILRAQHHFTYQKTHVVVIAYIPYLPSDKPDPLLNDHDIYP